MQVIRWALRLIAAAAFLWGVWLASQPLPASTASGGQEIKGWLLLILPIIYFVADYRLKRRADERADRADERADRAEAREIEAHSRRMGDKH